MLETHDQRAQIEELLHLTRRNLVNLGRGLFPQSFTIKPSPIHYELSNALVCTDSSVAFALPRGFGKSTYAWELMSAWNVLHRKYRYIMFIGATSTIAEDMFSNVKAQLTSHPVLSSSMKVIRDTSTRFFYQSGGVSYFLACFGAGQQLRGKRFESIRPDLVIMDDLETTEDTRSDEMRKKMKDWFFADVLPLDIHARFFLIGTYLHEDCLLANIIGNPPMEARTGKPWTTFRFGVLDYDTGKPTWPEKYDEAWINLERKKYIENGMLFRFNTEYQNIAVDRQDRSFDPRNVRFFSPEQFTAARNGGLDVIIVVDPGIKGDPNSHDPTVVLTSAMDSLGNQWVLNIVRKNMPHHQILETIIEEYKKFSPRRVLIESVQAQEYLLQDLEHGRFTDGLFLPVERIDTRQVRMGKIRIHGLEDMFYRRKIMIPASAPWWVDFCDEMVTFPRGKHDDMLDCMAYAKMNHNAPCIAKFDVEAIINQRSSTVF